MSNKTSIQILYILPRVKIDPNNHVKVKIMKIMNVSVKLHM